MKRYLIGLGMFLLLAMAAADAIWPAERQLLIDGGEWCDVNHPPRPRPRVKGLIEPVNRNDYDQRTIA